ncbi:MAG: FHA domain-containing protein [Anaerolineae bacterium]|nr:FHA domain-containing protein [Anaerolineae bacterium]
MISITYLESLAERLVEGTFVRVFAGQLSILEIATQLARAVEDCSASRLPDRFEVRLHPRNCQMLATDGRTLEQELARQLYTLTAQAGLELLTLPAIDVVSDERVGLHEVRVEARRMSEKPAELEKTREIGDKESIAEPPPGRPFLILDGRRHVNLVKPIVSIGRALDNDIIIDDARVSRHHAQLRRRYGHYVLYDLGSAGGTKVNNYPVEECVLYSGDVISLAGVQIIYGEDPPTSTSVREEEHTPPLGSQVPPVE